MVDIASGVGDYGLAITDLLNSEFDNTDLTKPHAYLVWMQYDNSMNLMPEGSGALRVTNANELERLIEEEIPILTDGYLHAYVSNGSAKGVSFDNILVTSIRGKLRQINDYYPFGLAIAGLNGIHDDYLNKYTSKELQTSEFANEEGLEMYDFGSRFYDAQLGRWFTVDPAMQFHNPYLAMGNNPVMYISPDGEFIFAAVGIGILANALITGALIGAASYTASVAMSSGGFDNWNGRDFAKSIGIGAVSGVLTAGIGSAFGSVGGTGSALGNVVKEGVRAGFHGASSMMVNTAFGQDVNIGTYATGAFSSVSGSLTSNLSAGNQAAISSLAGGTVSQLSGGNFWAGAANGLIVSGLNHGVHIQKHNQQTKLQVNASRAFLEDLGYGAEQVAGDVVAHTDGGIFSKKYARLLNFAPYESSFSSGYYDSLSDDYSAFLSTSQTVKGATFQMKYYPGRSNSVGLIQAGAAHYFETAMEIIDGRIRDWSGRDNTFYHMHEGNALQYLLRTGRPIP